MSTSKVLHLKIKTFKNLCFTWFFVLFAVFTGYMQTTPAGFNLVAYEGFDYPNNTDISNQSGGFGWSGNWEAGFYGNSTMMVYSSGLTYTGLSVTGNRLQWGGPGLYQPHSVRRSINNPNSGIVYVQFISDFNSSGGGTDRLDLNLEGTTLASFGGNNPQQKMSILAGGEVINSTYSVFDLSLVIIQIDYTNNTTKMWVKPTVSNFDYSNPGTPDAMYNNSVAFDTISLTFRSGGQIDEITVFSQISAPTIVSGTTAICDGDSTTLTASGGTTNSSTIDVWYLGVCGGEAFSEGWDTQPYTTQSTTLNSNVDGVLNVTSTSADPMIEMFGIGSFDPAVYKNINFRYRVVSGTAGSAQIFFINTATGNTPAGSHYLSTSLISDNAWHIATLDMSAHALWATGGNITGWRFDYATASGATMDIDFIELGSSPIIGTGSSILVTPSTDTMYYVNRKGPNVNTSCISQLITVNALPTPTFSAEPSSTVAIDTDVTYMTQAGQSNYDWTIPGVLNTDYSITSGGTSTDNTVVLKWLTIGDKTITVNYDNANGCAAATAITSLISYARKKGLSVNGLQSLSKSTSVDRNGGIGTNTALDINGGVISQPGGNGLTAASAAKSAKQILIDYPSSPDGIYWITNANINGGTPFQIYADMTTDSGGWMLLNVGAGDSAASEMSTVSSPDVLGYLSRTTVIELALLCTDVQLRSGASSTSYAHKTTSTSPLAIGALQSAATDVNGAGTWANGADATFVVNSGSWLWAYCCPGSAAGWPKMYHSSNYTNGVHWYADSGVGRKNSSPRDAWFSTWIR